MPGRCPRCDKMAYDAEAKKIEGPRFYHPRCFKCLECQKGLQLTDYKVRKESIRNIEIYCASCYGSLFGPKGFRGGAGAGGMMISGKTGSVANKGTPTSASKTSSCSSPTTLSATSAASVVSPVKSKDPCMEWEDYGSCRRGDSCLYAHIGKPASTALVAKTETTPEPTPEPEPSTAATEPAPAAAATEPTPAAAEPEPQPEPASEEASGDSKECPDCGSPVPQDSASCEICGAEF